MSKEFELVSEEQENLKESIKNTVDHMADWLKEKDGQVQWRNYALTIRNFGQIMQERAAELEKVSERYEMMKNFN